MVDVFAELEALKAELAAERAARLVAEAKVSSIDALIASLKLDTSNYPANFGVICFNRRVVGGIETCRINLAFSMSMIGYAG